MDGGFLLLDKPVGMSSFGAVKKIRYVSGIKKVGHAGTLDPFASGLLILALGKKFTRQIDMLQGLDKTYEATLVLGISTDTLDPYGQITGRDTALPSIEEIKAHIAAKLPTFLGNINQIPPQFSAKQVNGERAYKAARNGKALELKPINVQIHAFDCLDVTFYHLPMIHFRITCTKGTYVRTLLTDLAAAIGYHGYTQNLRRTHIGQYSTKMALTVSQFNAPSQIENGLFDV